MANPAHLATVKEGVDTWNRWRRENPDIEADLSRADLNRHNLANANLSETNLQMVQLNEADLRETDLRGANLRGGFLRSANLSGANLCGANLSGIQLRLANLSRAKLDNVKLFFDLHNPQTRQLMYESGDFILYVTDNTADFGETNLRDASLIGSIFIRANFYRSDLTGANLKDSDLRGANLSEADLSNTTLFDINLYLADLRQAKLTSAKLTRAKLVGASLRFADMSKVDLSHADLSRANLTDANLRAADLSSARLQQVTLNHAILTDTRLWETQRSKWSIKGIICERAYWDQEIKTPEHYAPGEFERLYSDTTRIELLYPGGMTTFELNTLPALLHHLTSKYPNSGIRLKSIEETGGGARISLSVEEADPYIIEGIQTLSDKFQSTQLALRNNEIEMARLEGKFTAINQAYNDLVLHMTNRTQVHFAGEATNVAIAIGNSTVTAHQTHNDAKALLALLDQIKSHTAELPHPQQTQLADATQSIEHELSKPEPKRSVIYSGLQVVKEIAIKVVASGAEKTIEEHWHPWLSQLTALVQHWTS